MDCNPILKELCMFPLISMRIWGFSKFSLAIGRGSLGFFTIGLSDIFLSDYLTDLKLHKIIFFFKNYLQWGLNLQPPDHQSHALLTVLGRNLLEISEVSFLFFMHHFTCWTLFISGINRAQLHKGLNDSHRQPNSDLTLLTTSLVSSDLESESFNSVLFPVVRWTT